MHQQYRHRVSLASATVKILLLDFVHASADINLPDKNLQISLSYIAENKNKFGFLRTCLQALTLSLDLSTVKGLLAPSVMADSARI